MSRERFGCHQVFEALSLQSPQSLVVCSICKYVCHTKDFAASLILGSPCDSYGARTTHDLHLFYVLMLNPRKCDLVDVLRLLSVI